MIMNQTEVHRTPQCCIGDTPFEVPFLIAGAANQEDRERYLGIRDLWRHFERTHGPRQDQFWGFMLMEMITDPMLRQWVPDWLVEQYERQNPFFREVLTALQEENLQRNKTLLKRAKREMIKRHALHKKRSAMKEDEKLSDAEKDGGES